MKTSRIVLFGGTTEGRKLAEYLAGHEVQVYVCVTTSYGESLMNASNLHITHEPMDEEEMDRFFKEVRPDFVIDATHPYAREVTAHVKEACLECGLTYLRLVRESTDPVEKAVYVEDIVTAADYLTETTGNILVTTGSKELQAYTRIPQYRERIYARVLPTSDVVRTCEELGFAGPHLICMQGPFSEEMNRVVLKEHQIRYLVTKDSGVEGGFPQKAAAAEDTGATLVVIGRPEEEEGYTYTEMIRLLREKLGVKNDSIHVDLVGIGMGSGATLTEEGKEALSSADLLIGASRMVGAVKQEGQPTCTAYRPEEILKAIREHPDCTRVAVALSGDAGFFSGAKEIQARLDEEPDLTVCRISGISSVSYFCAKLGISWEDAALVSIHGQSANVISEIRTHRKTFVLAGDAEGIRSLFRQMTEYGYGTLPVAIGENLSYENEVIRKGQASDFCTYDGSGLAVLYIEHAGSEKESGGFGINDEAFLRGKVPMTKAEIRSIVLSKLELKKDAVVYDIGAGTGSVAVEAARQATEGQVYAIEREEAALTLIAENQKRFKVDNLSIVSGEAPEALQGLPVPDSVFIGGSGGRLKEILERILTELPEEKPVRCVLDAITLETLSGIVSQMDELRRAGVMTLDEVLQVSVAKSRPAGSVHIMTGQNPVYIASFTLQKGKKL